MLRCVLDGFDKKKPKVCGICEFNKKKRLMCAQNWFAAFQYMGDLVKI